MPKLGTIELFKYSELSEPAKEKAREHFCASWMNHNWWDFTCDHMKEEGHHKHGFYINDIRFSGFWSQGDGASWSGVVKLKEWVEHTFNTTDKEHPLTQIFLALLDEGWITERVSVLYDNSRYCHENTMDVENIDHYYRLDESVMEMGMFKGAEVGELIKLLGETLATLDMRLTEDCKAFAREVYKQLQEDYESQTSDESVSETYDANQAWFRENGRFLTLGD